MAQQFFNYETYKLGDLAEQIGASEGSRHKNVLVVPPYANDPYAGLFKPGSHPEYIFTEAFSASLAALRTIIGIASFSYSASSEFGSFHDTYKAAMGRFNRSNLPAVTLKTDYTVNVGNQVRDPSYPPRVPLVHYLSGVLSKPTALYEPSDGSKKRRPRKVIDRYRQQNAREKMRMQPMSTLGYYNELSEDEHGNPTEVFAENAFAWKAVVFTWDQVSHPEDGKLRNPPYNVVPHDVWVFHSVRFAVKTKSRNAEA